MLPLVKVNFMLALHAPVLQTITAGPLDKTFQDITLLLCQSVLFVVRTLVATNNIS